MASICVREKYLLFLVCVVSATVLLCSLYVRPLSPQSSRKLLYHQPKPWSENDSTGTLTPASESTTTSDEGFLLFNLNLSKQTTAGPPPQISTSVHQETQALHAQNIRPTLRSPHQSSTSESMISSLLPGSLTITHENIRPSTWRGYLLSANIEQQMTQAASCYGDLATLGALLHLSSVQPYVGGTKLVTLPEKGAHPMNLSTFYDLQTFKGMIRSCSSNNDHEMATFETFLKTASPDVILVYFLTSLGKHKSKFSKGKIVEIGSGGKATPKALDRLNKWAAYMSKWNKQTSRKFRVRRVLVIDARPKKPLHLQVILYKLQTVVREQSSKSGSVTVLLDNWRGIHSKPNSYFFYYVPEFYNPCSQSIHKVSHSQAIIDASRLFQQSLNDAETETKIGVHIRGEKLFIKYKNFAKCFQTLSNVLHEVAKNTSTVRVIHDFGKYGTRSCHGSCTHQRQKFLTQIKKLGYRVVYFDPSKFPSFPRNSAFASFVECEYLSRMDVLVTVGFGSYQNSVVQRFLLHSNQNTEHLHRICT